MFVWGDPVVKDGLVENVDKDGLPEPKLIIYFNDFFNRMLDILCWDEELTVTDGFVAIEGGVVESVGLIVGWMQFLGLATKPHNKPTNKIIEKPPIKQPAKAILDK